VDARSVLGLPALRPALLDDVSAAQPRKGQARDGAGVVSAFTLRLSPDDDFDDGPDEDEEDDDVDDTDGEEDEDNEDEDEDEEETWQVSGRTRRR